MSDTLVQLVLRGARLTMVVRAFGIGVSFLSHTYFAPLLGRDQYGTYAFVLAWVSVLALLATFGVDTLLTRMAAVYRGASDWAHLQGLYLWSRGVATRTSLAIAAFGATILLVTRGVMPEEMSATFAVGLLLMIALTWKNVRQGALRGLRLVVYSEALDNLLRPLVMLALAYAIADLWAETPRAVHLMGANLGGAALALVVGSVLVGRLWPAEARAASPERDARTWRDTALPLLITAGIYLLLSRTDILMLGILDSSASAATYAVITRFSDLMTLGLMSATAMIGPVAAELAARGDRAQLQRVVTKAVQWSSALTVLLGIVLLLFGKLLLSLFGAEYVEGYAPMTILLVGQAVNALAGPVGYLLSMTGHQQRVVQVLGLSAILNVGLNAVLIPFFGVLGAASATALTNLVWNVVLHVSVRRRLQIDSTALGRPPR